MIKNYTPTVQWRGYIVIDHSVLATTIWSFDSEVWVIKWSDKMKLVSKIAGQAWRFINVYPNLVWKILTNKIFVWLWSMALTNPLKATDKILVFIEDCGTWAGDIFSCSNIKAESIK